MLEFLQKKSQLQFISVSCLIRILQLQRTAGNQAVQRIIKSGALKAKLKISQPNDIYEQEADRVAEQVMRMPDPVIQRKCAKCDEDEKRFCRQKSYRDKHRQVKNMIYLPSSMKCYALRENHWIQKHVLSWSRDSGMTSAESGCTQMRRQGRLRGL